MPEPITIVLVAGFGGVGLLAAFIGRRQNANRRLVEKTPTSAIADVKRGFFEVEGEIRAKGEPLLAPWSQSPCVHFKLVVQQRRDSTQNTASWSTLLSDRKSVAAVISDGTGTLEVNPSSMTLILGGDHFARSGTMNGPTPEMEALMERYGKSTKGWVFNKELRYEETVLKEGSHVYAIGNVIDHEGELVMTSNGPLAVLSDRGENAVGNALIGRTSVAYGIATLFIAIAGFVVLDAILF